MSDSFLKHIQFQYVTNLSIINYTPGTLNVLCVSITLINYNK